MPGRVVVVGSINVDLVVTAPRLPAPGETVLGGTFARHHGGKGGNQAVAAARLGATTSLVGAVGGDELGREARAALAADGVDLEGLVTLDGETTGVALIVVAPDGQNAIAVAPGANRAATPDVVEAGLRRASVGPGDVVLVGHEIPTEAAIAALRAARLAHASTVLNPAPALGMDLAMLAQADVTTPNEVELAELLDPGRSVRHTEETGESLLRAARAFMAARDPGDLPRALLVSLGPAGAALVTRAAVVTIPAPHVHAVDATGAGDALNGALAAGLAAGLDLEGAARRAVLAASISTSRRGARDGLPTAADLAALEPARTPPARRRQGRPSVPTQAENE